MSERSKPPPVPGSTPPGSPGAESPPRSRPAASAPPPPVPADRQHRQELAKQAMRLRDEQLRARVVYVDATLETNAELDKITEKVVADLQEMQRAGMEARTPKEAGATEKQLAAALQELLEKMVSARREYFIRHKIQLIQRRIANLYFSAGGTRSEAHGDVTYAYGDEAVLAALQAHGAPVLAALEGFRYRSPETKAQAVERWRGFERRLQSDVLARSRPELERLLAVYSDVLLAFLMEDFRKELEAFSAEVVQEARVAQGSAHVYKIGEKQFGRFREVFERKFMTRLLRSVQEPLATRLRDEPDHDYQAATVRFAADPQIYTEICSVTCNSVYDYLHGEGFLDLPVTWQKELYAE
ncbi:MAG: hypothetical protein AAGH15_18745 [Myxococcota bacterium]